MDNINTKEIGISTLRSLFAAVPFAGQILNEVAFEYRGRIKQERVNRFIELLSDYFIVDRDTNLENLKSEDFGDLFESVIQRVSKTKSLEKHKQLRNVLVNKIENPLSDISDYETYLDLITGLSEYEIKILSNHQKFDHSYETEKEEINDLKSRTSSISVEVEQHLHLRSKGLDSDYNLLLSKQNRINRQIVTKLENLGSLDEVRRPDYYGLSDYKFMYYKQSLSSRGLLVDSGIGTKPFELMSITEFGKEFINFTLNTY